MSNKLNPWDLDIRVRERNLKNGTLSDKDVEKMMSQLPDLTEQTDPVSTAQPALGDGGADDDDDDGEG
jgi:hypothetical protein